MLCLNKGLAVDSDMYACLVFMCGTKVPMTPMYLVRCNHVFLISEPVSACPYHIRMQCCAEVHVMFHKTLEEEADSVQSGS